MIWLSSRRNEIFKAPEATGGLVPAMLENLSRALTLLCAEATEHKGLASCPYLLSEDLEIRGLQTLEHDEVPEACRCYCNDAGEVKPRREHQAVGADVHKESLARLLDILRIGYFFAGDQVVPLAYHIVEDALVFEYSPNTPQVAQLANGAETTVRLKAQPETPADILRPRTGSGKSVQLATSANALALQSNEPTWSDFTNGDDITNDDTENTVMSMLTPFLKPPTPQSAGQITAPSETSYGLHSATAEEVFGTVAAQRSPGGTVLPTTFEQLPWGWLHTPTPQKGSRDHPETFSGQSRHTADSQGARKPNELLQDHLQSPLADRSASAVSQGRLPGPLRSPFSPSAEDAHRNELLQSFSGAGSAPRTSSFSHWSPDSHALKSRQISVASPWAPNPNSSMPMSTNMSGFSHPSSLYQGTPADGMQLGLTMPGSGGRRVTSSDLWQSSVPSDRQRQVDNTTSSYNAAIFDGALKD